ncbi:hypothetical protein PIB30_010448 [Stylosanthes scabra]|uniref:Uncharacterized protein n=1 Tax=Stylosanthes scabra TaxID=79078 RepID=A0ABU6Y3L5_9FABA|nr:hypothetical protein [Stylosanthes scabra]
MRLVFASLSFIGVILSNEDNRFLKCVKLVEDVTDVVRQALPVNPYEEHQVAMLTYLIAKICSAIARGANPSLVTATLLIFSSVIGFEAILWVVVAAQLLWFVIINVTILFVAVICFYKEMYNLLTTKTQESKDTPDHTVGLESQGP